MTPEKILLDAITVLGQRGRCKGDYELRNGTVDQLGALAVAAGADADMWRFWREFRFEELDDATLTLVDAAKILARVEAPLQPVHEMSLDRLVTLLSDSNDIASDAEVIDFLVKAAHEAARRAEREGAAA